MTSLNSWMGTSDAIDDLHDECFRRYGDSKLPSYHFSVADDFSAVEIVSAADEPDSANGIWTLAEIRAAGKSWREVAAVAAMMRAAIRKA